MLRIARISAAALVVCGLLAGISPARAGEEPPVTGKLAKLTLSGVGWATYRYQLGDQPDRDAYGGSRPGTPDYASRQVLNGKDMNQFDVDRAYLTADYALDERFSWQTQVEMSNVGGKLDIWMKKAFVKVKRPFGLAGTFVQMGEIPHILTPGVEKAWGFRSVSTVPIDRYLGISTTWLGLGLGGTAGDGALDYELAVTNEKAYRRANDSKYKTFMGRVTLTPLVKSEGPARNLRLAAFAQTNSENPPVNFTPSASDNRNVWFEVMPYVQAETFAAGFEFAQKADKTPTLVRQETGQGTVFVTKVVTKTSQYIGGFLWADPVPRLRLFGRVDLVDPNTDADDDGFTNLIAGLSRTYVKGVRSIVDVEYTKYQEPPKRSYDADVTLSARLEVSL